MSNQLVRVEYTTHTSFKVPRGIDLADEDVVEEWWVKYDLLHIRYVNGKYIEIESFFSEVDSKYPLNGGTFLDDGGGRWDVDESSSDEDESSSDEEESSSDEEESSSDDDEDEVVWRARMNRMSLEEKLKNFLKMT